MKNIKLFLLTNILSLISLSLFAPVIHVNPTNPTGSLSPVINIPDAPPPRNITVCLDDGQENPDKALFGTNTNTNLIGTPITFAAIEALQTDTKSPIFMSESIMNNIVARQIIVHDFSTLSDDELKTKYEGTDKFASQSIRDAFKLVCKTIIQDNLNLKTAFNAFQTTPSQDTLDKVNQQSTLLNTDISTMSISIATTAFNGNTNDAETFLSDTLLTYIPCDNAFDSSKWDMGKTADGSYLLLPIDATETIEPNGFNYQNLDGFNGTAITNPFDTFNKDIKKAIANPNTDTKAAALSLLDIAKIPTTPNPDPSVITFTPEKYAKADFYFTGHGSPKTVNDAGTIANIDIDFFNQTVLPALEKSYTQTLIYETCYGSDVNAQAAFNYQDPLSFSVISGNSTQAVIKVLNSDYSTKINSIAQSEEALYKKTGAFSTPEQLQQKMIDAGLSNRFNQFFDKIQTSVAQGISDFFSRSQTAIYGIVGLPSIQLATTNTWMTADNVRDNLLQISTIKDRTNVVNDKPLIYDLPAGGGLLASTETILTPVQIKIGSELPFVVPLSIGEKTHYIKQVEIQDPSITAEMFLTQSIKPFFDETNDVTTHESLASKTIVIDSLVLNSLDKDNAVTVTLLVTKDWAMYTTTQDTANYMTDELPLHYVQFTKSSFSWKSTGTFNDYIKAAHDQATQEFIEVAKVRNISSTIQARQEALNVIGRLRGVVNLNLGTNDQLTIWNGTQEAITNNNNQPLSKEFLLTFSLQELQTFSNIIAKYIINLSPTDPLALATSQTLKIAYQQLDYKTLQQTLAAKIAINGETALDWYITLTLDDQVLIKNYFNATLQDTILPNLDLSILSIKQQLLIEDYLQTTLSITTDPTQIADINAKLQAVSAPRDPVKFNQHLQDQLNKLSALTDKSSILDWVSTLEDAEKTSIDLDITAFFVQEIVNDPYLQSYRPSNLDITEIFELKINLEKFSSNSSANQNSILEKASVRNGSPITLDTVNNALSGGSQIVNQSIQKSFSNNLSFVEQPDLLNPNSTNIYAQVFEELPFAMQSTIASNLIALKNAFADLLTYQQGLLPERIAAAATTADLNALRDDMVAAGMLLNPNNTPANFNARFNLLETQQNQRIAEHAPSIPNAGSTGTITFDPTIINEENNAPIAPNANPENPNSTNNSNQPVPSEGPTFKNEDLEAEKEKEYEEEVKQKEEAQAEERANEEAERNNDPQRDIGR